MYSFNTSIIEDMTDPVQKINNNVMFIKQNKQMFKFETPISDGNDYWVLQHYKLDEIQGVQAQKR